MIITNRDTSRVNMNFNEIITRSHVVYRNTICDKYTQTSY